jgi:hypothetical protein
MYQLVFIISYLHVHLMLYIFLAAALYTQTLTSNSLYNICYSLLPQFSTTGYGHLHGATNFEDVYSIICK